MRKSKTSNYTSHPEYIRKGHDLLIYNILKARATSIVFSKIDLCFNKIFQIHSETTMKSFTIIVIFLGCATSIAFIGVNGQQNSGRINYVKLVN